MSRTSILFAFITILPVVAQAQPCFDGEFRGLQTSITHTKPDGSVVTEPYSSKIGIYNRRCKAIRIEGSFANPGAGADQIPTAGLAQEHWWLSFEMLMKAQREYAECVARIEELQRLLGACLLTDPTCSPWEPLIIAVKEYWVPFGVVFNSKDGLSKPPRREDFIDHFVAGLSGLDQAIANRDLCLQTLEAVREQTRQKLGR
jgi:hypothetical protein